MKGYRDGSSVNQVVTWGGLLLRVFLILGIGPLLVLLQSGPLPPVWQALYQTGPQFSALYAQQGNAWLLTFSMLIVSSLLLVIVWGLYLGLVVSAGAAVLKKLFSRKSTSAPYKEIGPPRPRPLLDVPAITQVAAHQRGETSPYAVQTFMPVPQSRHAPVDPSSVEQRGPYTRSLASFSAARYPYTAQPGPPATPQFPAAIQHWNIVQSGPPTPGQSLAAPSYHVETEQPNDEGSQTIKRINLIREITSTSQTLPPQKEFPPSERVRIEGDSEATLRRVQPDPNTLTNPKVRIEGNSEVTLRRVESGPVKFDNPYEVSDKVQGEENSEAIMQRVEPGLAKFDNPYEVEARPMPPIDVPSPLGEFRSKQQAASGGSRQINAAPGSAGQPTALPPSEFIYGNPFDGPLPDIFREDQDLRRLAEEQQASMAFPISVEDGNSKQLKDGHS